MKALDVSKIAPHSWQRESRGIGDLRTEHASSRCMRERQSRVFVVVGKTLESGIQVPLLAESVGTSRRLDRTSQLLSAYNPILHLCRHHAAELRSLYRLRAPYTYTCTALHCTAHPIHSFKLDCKRAPLNIVPIAVSVIETLKRLRSLSSRSQNPLA
jgi:hypothetical protein